MASGVIFLVTTQRLVHLQTLTLGSEGYFLLKIRRLIFVEFDLLEVVKVVLDRQRWKPIDTEYGQTITAS